MLDFECKAKADGFSLVIGIDEAGRGPLAGPVVAAAVALKSNTFQNKIGDSKTLSPKERELAFHEILDQSYFGIGVASETVIDSINILQATFFAMSLAVQRLIVKLPQKHPCRNSHREVIMLIDGNQFKSDLPYRFEAIVCGDARSLSIACASILAKVTRDRILKVYDRVFPEYKFHSHKGYSTAEHRALLAQHGPCPIHRRSFSWS